MFRIHENVWHSRSNFLLIALIAISGCQNGQLHPVLTVRLVHVKYASLQQVKYFIFKFLFHFKALFLERSTYLHGLDWAIDLVGKHVVFCPSPVKKNWPRILIWRLTLRFYVETSTLKSVGKFSVLTTLATTLSGSVTRPFVWCVTVRTKRWWLRGTQTGGWGRGYMTSPSGGPNFR